MVEKCFGKYIKLCPSEKCTGCSACYNVCPTGSILMKEDNYAEMHPYINNSNCISCGLCQKVCPQLSKNELKDPQRCYAAWRKDEKKRKDSSSGGIAALLYEKLLDQGFVCYGVKFDSDKGAYFFRITKKSEVEDIKGSKYVQAEIGMMLKSIGEELSHGKRVLFIGTPCQAAGLEGFIVNTKYNSYKNNLIIVDFLCHGTVPGKYLLNEIERIKKDEKVEADFVAFRSNLLDRNYHFSLFKEGKIVYSKKAELQPYFYGFLNSLFCRESCTDCLYKQKQRVGDITIGDFIGLGKTSPISIPMGINPSVMLTNSSLGKKVLDIIENDCIFVERNISEAIVGGPSFKRKNVNNKKRKCFRKMYIRLGYNKSVEKIVRRFMWCDYIKNMMVTLIKKARRKILKLLRINIT